MYLHLVPRILHHMKNKCTLMSVSVPELSLELKADSLVAMKPYPNKTYRHAEGATSIKWLSGKEPTNFS